MKKKSLFDLAMENKKRNHVDNKELTQENKKYTIIDFVEISVKFIFYVFLFVLITIGATVLINEELRNQLIAIIQSNF